MPYIDKAVENKIRFDQGQNETLTTVIMADGLGRALYTAKQGLKRDLARNTDQQGWNVSGAVHYDAKGRVVAEGQTRFVSGQLAVLLSYAPEALLHPTLTTFDHRDRPVTVRLPSAPGSSPVEQLTYFSIANGLQVAETVDPEHNRGVRHLDGRSNIVYTARLSQSGTLLTHGRYRYNGLGELLTAWDAQGNPLEVRYDFAGRKTMMQSPDMGEKRYGYDMAGNLIWEEDDMLRNAGHRITYTYDGMNRLSEIVYPRREDTSGPTRTAYEYGAPGAANNSAGRVLSVTDESGFSEYRYGKLGETVREQRSIHTLMPTTGVTSVSAVMEYQSDYLGRMEQITYPDGEILRYAYDYGGQVKTVIGTKVRSTGHQDEFKYVSDVGYDEYGQRIYIEYGNGVETSYSYDPYRRWLATIETTKDGNAYQNIKYSFSETGNVTGYTNNAGRYQTQQQYRYDDLYQLISATGTTVQYRYAGGAIEDYRSEYRQSFSYDSIGNMRQKTSAASITNNMQLAGDLNYDLAYKYYRNGNADSHRAEQIGDIYYLYDANGNMTEERFGSHSTTARGVAPYNQQDRIYSTDYGFALTQNTGSGSEVYQRNYTWDWRNQLIMSKDSRHTVYYRYGHDGQRALKYAVEGRSETAYFNNMWQMSNTVGGDATRWMETKHIFVGSSRIATKHGYGTESAGFETEHQYYYHSDHLGSAQMITNNRGQLHERIEYAPYGESWIEHRYPDYDNVHLPFRFTGKELDSETGLYYFGARYLDPKTARWLSGDPAISEYVPSAPVSDEARKRNDSLPGMGGVFNVVNLHVYHYAGNNPVRYTDPDGESFFFTLREIFRTIEKAINDAIGKAFVDAGLTPENLERASEILEEINDNLQEIHEGITTGEGRTGEKLKEFDRNLEESSRKAKEFSKKAGRLGEKLEELTKRLKENNSS